MASVANQILVDTKVGIRGDGGKRQISWNQRFDNFSFFSKLSGTPARPVKVLFETSPNGEDWVKLHEVELKEDGEFDLEDCKRHMLSQCRVSYSEDSLYKTKKKNAHDQGQVEKLADVYIQVCYRDKK